jgi:hypothetical protein
MSELRVIADAIELGGQPVARLLPKLSPTLVYRLTEMFDSIGEDAEYIAELEGVSHSWKSD